MRAFKYALRLMIADDMIFSGVLLACWWLGAKGIELIYPVWLRSKHETGITQATLDSSEGPNEASAPQG